jgi:hypothetical protein
MNPASSRIKFHQEQTGSRMIGVTASQRKIVVIKVATTGFNFSG